MAFAVSFIAYNGNAASLITLRYKGWRLDHTEGQDFHFSSRD